MNDAERLVARGEDVADGKEAIVAKKKREDA